MTAHHSSTDLVITRVFDAPVERVWEAWTDPTHIKKWWGPKDFTAPHVHIDFRVGGKYLYAMHGSAGTQFDMDMWSAGEFREIVPMQKIVATDHFADKDGNYISPNSVGMPGTWADEMIVTVTFEDMGNGKTKVIVVHEGHPQEMVENATAGWNQQLDKLEAVL